jgi:SEC-C motif
MPFAASIPPPLTPQERMGRNDPCWCRSGRKWKHCHLGRDKQPRPNISELLNAIGQDQARGYCVHPDAGIGTCSGDPTDAHTIQKEGGLRAIAENGHVISSKKGAFAIARNDGEIIPQRDGIGTASTAKEKWQGASLLESGRKPPRRWWSGDPAAGALSWRDSRVTLMATLPNLQNPGSNQQFIVPATFDNASKLLRVKGQDFVGAVTFGAGSIGTSQPRTASSYIPEFESELAKESRLDVEEFARRLADFFLRQWSSNKMPSNPMISDNMIFFVAGYDDLTSAYGRVFEVSV